MIKKAMMILLLVAVAGCQVTMLPPDDPEDLAKAETKKNETDTLERIRVMKIVHEETLLMRDIILLKADIAKIQAVNAPPEPARQRVEIPELGVEGEFVPLDELPENMR